MRRHNRHTAPNGKLLGIPAFRGCSPRQLAEIDRLTDQSVILAGRVLLREGMIEGAAELRDPVGHRHGHQAGPGHLDPWPR